MFAVMLLCCYAVVDIAVMLPVVLLILCVLLYDAAVMLLL